MNRFLDDRLTSKKRENTQQSRIINSKMPIFLQIASHHTSRHNTVSTVSKIGAAPASGIDRNSTVAKSSDVVANR